MVAVVSVIVPSVTGVEIQGLQWQTEVDSEPPMQVDLNFITSRVVILKKNFASVTVSGAY